MTPLVANLYRLSILLKIDFKILCVYDEVRLREVNPLLSLVLSPLCAAADGRVHRAGEEPGAGVPRQG